MKSKVGTLSIKNLCFVSPGILVLSLLELEFYHCQKTEKFPKKKTEYYYEVCWSNLCTVNNGLTMNPRTLFFLPEQELDTCIKFAFP